VLEVGEREWLSRRKKKKKKKKKKRGETRLEEESI
jgi:hypothetical protein